MTIDHEPRSAAPDPDARPDVERHLREARRLRAEAMAATFRAIGGAAARLGRRLRLALLRQRVRQRARAGLEGYTDPELQRDLLFPRSEIGRIAAEEADRRLAAFVAGHPAHRRAAG